MARILISEPFHDVQRLLERMLTRLGHESVAVGMPDAEQLMSADALILEPLEPVGAVLAQAASIAHPSLPLICASVALPGAEFAELGVVFSACLIKPFTTSQLEAAIEQVLHAPRGSRDDRRAEDRQPTTNELPLRRSDRQEPSRVASKPTPISAALTEAAETPETLRRRMLLVEDDRDIRTAVCTSLEQAGGWLVIPVESGEAALDSLLSVGRLDAVLLDVTMPGLGGPATLEGLRECGLPEEVPIVFLTTNPQDNERQALIFLGGVGVIAKPIDPPSLPSEVQRMLA